MEEKIDLTYLDDDLTNLKLIQQALSSRYNVNCFSSPEEFLNNNPADCDILLLDVDMPEINGYDVCRILRNERQFDKPVLFLSGHNEIDDRLKGYNAGGNEYISKPFNIEELTLKLDKNLRQYQQLNKTIEQLQQASSTAMTAMTNASELGIVMNFTQKLHTCNQARDLVQSLKEVLAGFGLSAVFSFRTLKGANYYSAAEKALTQLEKELLDAFERCEKIATHGYRCLLSSRNVSILIKNMPPDSERKGRMRDHLALILDTTHHQLSFLNTKIQQEQQQELFISKLQQDMKNLITDIDTSIGQSRKRSSSAVEKIKQELLGLELQLGLSEDSAIELQNISNQLQDELDIIFDEFDSIEQQIDLLVGAIQNFHLSQ